jgi:hypothetical protein
LGRQKGFRPKSDKLAPKVMKLIENYGDRSANRN